MLSVLVPSYGRPNECMRMYQSAKKTARGGVQVHVALEASDPSYSDYCTMFPADVLHKGSWGNAVLAWNYLASNTTGEVVHMGSDDLVYETEGWDTIFAEMLEKDPWLCLHYKDKLLDEKMALNPVVSRKWINTIGYINPKLEHFYGDTHFEDIARRAKVLRYLPHVTIVQRHYKNGLAPVDATHHRVRPEGRHERDHATWLASAKDRQRLASIVQWEHEKYQGNNF